MESSGAPEWGSSEGGSAAGALQWPGNISRSVRECCKSVAVARKQQLHLLGVLLEGCSGQEAAAAAPRSVAGALLERSGGPEAAAGKALVAGASARAETLRGRSAAEA